MTYTQLHVEHTNGLVGASVFVPTWAVCSLRPGDTVRLQSPELPYSTTVWTVTGFGRTDWNTSGVHRPQLPVPVATSECPVWGREDR